MLYLFVCERCLIVRVFDNEDPEQNDTAFRQEQRRHMRHKIAIFKKSYVDAAEVRRQIEEFKKKFNYTEVTQ